MDQKLHQFVALLHRPVPGASRKRGWRGGRMRGGARGIGRRAILVASAAILAGGGLVALWLAWPALQGRQRHSPPVDVRIPVAANASASVAPPPPMQAPSPPPQVAAVPPPAAAPPEQSAEPAWLRFAVPTVVRDGRARIAIIIDDMGLDRPRSERAIALPGPLTLSFLAYARDLPQQTALAHRGGHELMVHVPMEPMGRMLVADPNQLEVAMSREEVLTRLRWDLSRFEGYVGINNHMGSRFTADALAMRPVLEELKARGLLFVDSRTTPSTAGAEIARELGVPHASRDVFLDYEVSIAAIEARLAELERVARRNGSAIAIGHPHDQTLEVLQRWLRELPQKDLALVPVSAIVRERDGRELAHGTTGVTR
jgi:polysaccharide deacetylase 2 family uncharacterized protein YibQ